MTDGASTRVGSVGALPGAGPAVTPRSADTGETRRWTRREVASLATLLLAGLALRAALWPTRGHFLDLDLFVSWVRGIAVDGIGHAYDQPLSFPPVMVYIWAILGVLEPAFRTAVDSSDLGIRSLMKLPASLADLGIAASVAWWFRDRPRWAIVAAGVVVFSPTTWYVSAWWAQFESLYVLSAVLAVLAARANRPNAAAVLMAVCVMTKPQALPLLLPFVVWCFATRGPRDTIRALVIGASVGGLLWLPFIPAGGPVAYLGSVRDYESGVIGVVSMNAWNPWWLLEAGAQAYVRDSITVVGPLTYRTIGFIAFALASVPVVIGLRRDPSPERLALALAAITLVAFTTLTTIHGRYSYAAFPLLLMACGQPRVRYLFAAFTVVFGLNLLLVTPAGVTVPFLNQLGIVGPVVMTAIAVVSVWWVVQPPQPSTADQGNGPEPPKPMTAAVPG